jgi:regulator of sirC expression with transglutaminase-like and TPR domain
LSVPAPAARSRFAAMVGLPDEAIDLASAALLIAAEEYPQLVIEPYLRRLDLLAERVRDRLSDETAPVVVLQDVSRVLFVEEGFHGNQEDYFDPRNFFLNDVLDRRVGIPITLSIIYLEVGWRLGLQLEGVNFPAHFMVRYCGEALRLLIDPFQTGVVRFEDEAQELLDHAYGGGVELRPEFLRPASRKDILVRLLSNLKSIYLNHQDDVRALNTIERILLIRPESHDDVRDRGMTLVRLGREAEAIPLLREYLQRAPTAADAPSVRLLLDQLEPK